MDKIIDWNKVKTVDDLKAIVLLDMYSDYSLFKRHEKVAVRSNVGSKAEAIKAVEHLFI